MTTATIQRQKFSPAELRERIAELRRVQRSSAKRRGRAPAAWHALFNELNVGEQIVVQTNAKNVDGNGDKVSLPKFMSVRNWLQRRAKVDGRMFLVFGASDADGNGEMLVIRSEDDPEKIVSEDTEDTDESGDESENQ